MLKEASQKDNENIQLDLSYAYQDKDCKYFVNIYVENKSNNLTLYNMRFYDKIIEFIVKGE